MMGFQSIKRVLYVVPVLGALAFGATQAFASVTSQQSERACSVRCYTECGRTGGFCTSGGFCACY